MMAADLPNLSPTQPPSMYPYFITGHCLGKPLCKLQSPGSLSCNGPFHATLEGIQSHVNEIASFSGVHCNAIFGLKCIELMGFFSIFEASLYRNYKEFSNKLNNIIRAFFDLFNSPNRLHVGLLVAELQRVEEDLLLLY